MKKEGVKRDLKTRSEIALTPLAIPMLAGPGTISLLITYNQQYSEILQQLTIVGAIIFTSFTIYFILKGSHFIVKILGGSGINALSRIIGFVVIAIGIEYIISAILSIINNINYNIIQG